jgi:hypothetical protein
MLYLAQVQNQGIPNQISLIPLACQKSEYAWVVLPEPATKAIPFSTTAADWADGMLVLADCTEDYQVSSIAHAKDWLLAIIQTFLSSGITPEFLQQETQRAEQWRQSLTLQSQEVDRRALELEARREQIQELEENLHRQQKALAAQSADSETPESSL